MNGPILSISVPTYNRGPMLMQLLARLRTEIDSLPAADRKTVAVDVCDNASTDGTDTLVRTLCVDWNQLTYFRSEMNGGMDANFRRCYEKATGDFLWVIGDDDLLVEGTLSPLLQMLGEQRPDCVYLKNRWMKDVGLFFGSNKDQALTYRRLTAVEFAKETFVWLSFLSAVIVNRKAVATEDSTASWLDRLHGSHLSQLAWVFTSINKGQKFVFVDTVCVLATSGNTGGYSVMHTFAITFFDTVNGMFGENTMLASVINHRTKTLYLPDLVWSGRAGSLGAFERNEGWAEIDHRYKNDRFYRWILRPLAHASRPTAQFVWVVWRVYSKWIRSTDARRRLRLETAR